MCTFTFIICLIHASWVHMIILRAPGTRQDARDSVLNKTKWKYREEGKTMEEASKKGSKEEEKRNK